MKTAEIIRVLGVSPTWWYTLRGRPGWDKVEAQVKELADLGLLNFGTFRELCLAAGIYKAMPGRPKK
jgi:hypothetical protein